MRLFAKWTRALLAAGLSCGAILSIAASAPADPIPFQDQYQDGSLTFCNQKGQPVTSGSLYTVPFVWTVVSSTPAPQGYTRADLLVFQPIQYVDPSGWAGYQMSDGAIFSNPRHPMAQMTYADNPLLWPDRAYPPYWDGLYEIRMYFSGPDVSESTNPYPAAVIQVTGSTWRLLSGGGTPCNVGSAVSVESYLLPKAKTETPRTIVPAAGGSSSSVSKSTPTVLPAEPSTPSTSASSSQLAAGALPNDHHGGGTSAGVLAGAVVIALAIVGGTVAMLLHRRRRLPLN
jgi:hypothetical protein